jgi:hypothetical protein
VDLLAERYFWKIFSGIICGFVAGKFAADLCLHFQQQIPQENFLKISKSAGNNYLRR